MATAVASAAIDPLVEPTIAFVKKYMESYDSSHDFAHIQRVVHLALTLYDAQIRPLRRRLVLLAAYLHDIGDSKYASEADNPTPARSFLLSIGAEPELAESVQTIVSHVSFSKEKKDPQAVQEVLREYPELGVVQDADRLDALGAIGIGRCFTYGATRSAKDRATSKSDETSSMDNAIAHFEEKLVLLQKMMKTERGSHMAKERTQRLIQFKDWWRDELEGQTLPH